MKLDALETDRLLLRPQHTDDAGVFRALWTERDPRVPPHRRIDDDGRPSLADIATHVEAGEEPGLLTVVRKGAGDVIGYCGVVFHGSGERDEPELAFELLAGIHGNGYATEASRVVIAAVRATGHERLWASVWEWNGASRRVLEKLDFVDSGRAMSGGEFGRNILMVCDLMATR